MPHVECLYQLDSMGDSAEVYMKDKKYNDDEGKSKDNVEKITLNCNSKLN